MMHIISYMKIEALFKIKRLFKRTKGVTSRLTMTQYKSASDGMFIYRYWW